MGDLETPEADIMQDQSSSEAAATTLRAEESDLVAPMDRSGRLSLAPTAICCCLSRYGAQSWPRNSQDLRHIG
jgi:hypothetical protein